jgi:hypothetical protein
MYRPRRPPAQLVDEAATDEDFFSPPEEPEELEEPDELDEPDEPLEPDELELPESPDELADFDESELPEELSDDEPFEPLADASLAAGTVLDPFRLSVR